MRTHVGIFSNDRLDLFAALFHVLRVTVHGSVLLHHLLQLKHKIDNRNILHHSMLPFCFFQIDKFRLLNYSCCLNFYVLAKLGGGDAILVVANAIETRDGVLTRVLKTIQNGFGACETIKTLIITKTKNKMVKDLYVCN